MRKDRFNISFDDFCAPCEKHEFSDGYIRAREHNKQKYLYNKYRITRITSIAFAAALFVATPFVVNAATDGEFFQRVWGMMGKNNVEAHKELVYEEGKDSWYYIDYPAREYVDVDSEAAQALIGDCVEDLNISKKVDGTTITVLSAVRDNNSAVVELTMEKEGGVDVLNYSQLDNESKGAWFSDASTFYLTIGDSGNMYVDLDRSTEEKLYCYYYVSLNAFGKGSLNMKIYQYPCTFGERDALSRKEDADKSIGEIESKKKTFKVDIPCEKRLKAVEFVNSDGGVIEISPISMNIDMNTGLGLTPEEAYDPYRAYKVCIMFDDGSSYTVIEHGFPGVYSCDKEIDNTSYGCGSLKNEFLLVFNRLVDTDKIESITVNDIEYKR